MSLESVRCEECVMSLSESSVQCEASVWCNFSVCFRLCFGNSNIVFASSGFEVVELN